MFAAFDFRLLRAATKQRIIMLQPSFMNILGSLWVFWKDDIYLSFLQLFEVAIPQGGHRIFRYSVIPLELLVLHIEDREVRL